MSVPPESSGPPGASVPPGGPDAAGEQGGRRPWAGAVVELGESSGGWRKRLGRREDERRMTVTAAEITIEHAGVLLAPLRLAPGRIAVGALDPGAAHVDRGKAVGRFPVLRQMTDSAVIPREEGIEGWLWTSSGGSAMTLIAEPDQAPNLAFVFLSPLEEEVVVEVFDPSYLDELTKRSPLGKPTVFGVLLRVANLEAARAALTRIGVLARPLTDRIVPPVQRRHLPDDKPANPEIRGATTEGPQTSVPPPGMG